MEASKFNKAIPLAIAKGYTVDNNGTVKGPNGKTRKLLVDTVGYFYFDIKTLNSRKNARVRVHRLVAYNKFGEYMLTKGIEVRHLNGNPLDNSWDNIAVGTHAENQLDIPVKTRLAMARKAARVQRKLSDDRLAEFRADRLRGLSYNDLCKKYRLSKSTVSYVCQGKTYKT